MSRSSLSLWEMLPVFIMLTLKGQDLEPWMRQLIDMINGTQNTVKEMQKGINTLHGAVYQLIMPLTAIHLRNNPRPSLIIRPLMICHQLMISPTTKPRMNRILNCQLNRLRNN